MRTARTLSAGLRGVKPAIVYRKLNRIGYQRDQQQQEAPKDEEIPMLTFAIIGCVMLALFFGAMVTGGERVPGR